MKNWRVTTYRGNVGSPKEAEPRQFLPDKIKSVGFLSEVAGRYKYEALVI